MVETQAGRTNKTVLIRAIAGEVLFIARQILNPPPHLEQEGDQLLRGTKRLNAKKVAQWEQEIQEEDREVEETALSLRETGAEAGFPNTREDTSDESGTPTSHRRRRLLAAHHKEFIGEDGDEDESCQMAMGRPNNSGTSSSSPNMGAPGDVAEGADFNDTGEDGTTVRLQTDWTLIKKRRIRT